MTRRTTATTAATAARTTAATIDATNTEIDAARRENNRLREAAEVDLAFVPKDRQKYVQAVVGAAFDAALFLIAVRLGKKRKKREYDRGRDRKEK